MTTHNLYLTKGNKISIEAPTAKVLLEQQSRDKLRQVAKKYDIKRGRNKTDTIKNILNSEYPIDFRLN